MAVLKIRFYNLKVKTTKTLYLNTNLKINRFNRKKKPSSNLRYFSIKIQKIGIFYTNISEIRKKIDCYTYENIYYFIFWRKNVRENATVSKYDVFEI